MILTLRRLLPALLALGFLTASARAQNRDWETQVVVDGIDIYPIVGAIEAISEQHGHDHAALERIREYLEELTAPRFSVQFEGGSAMDYIRAVRSASKHNNIVTMPGVEDFSMPAVTLTEVTVEGALTPLQYARPMNDLALQENIELDVDDDGNVFVVAPDEAWPPRPEVDQAVWSAAEMLEMGVQSQDLLFAIDAAIQTSDGYEHTDIKFHPETKLLIIRAPHDILEIVDSVLDGIEETAEAAAERQEQLWELRAEADEMSVEVEHARAELDNARDQLSRARAQVQQGEMHEQELEHFHEHIRELQRELGRFESRLQRIQSYMGRLSDQGVR